MEDNNHLIDAFKCFHWAYQLTEDKRYYGQAAKLQHTIEERSRRLSESIEELEEMQRQAQQKPYQPVVKRWVPPAHGASCQCLTCRQNRQMAGKAVSKNGLPEHTFHRPHFP